ncbi:MAG: hypothetical protein IAX22_07380 [Candidatus Bathyarchaeota archaeon]|nr:hypothetical protein [Candidatus Bathyarchaeota archaeon]
MFNLKLGICFCLVFVLLSGLVASVSATEYKVGVSVGQWIAYGNYDVIDSGDQGTIPAWSKLEVSSVSEQRVLFYASGMYRNGSEFYYHADRSITANNTLIISANLTQGDFINLNQEALINRTETRKYLGTERVVNVIEHSETIEELTYSALFVYDQISGVLLEYKVEETLSAEQMSTAYKYAYSIVDTNIFAVSDKTGTDYYWGIGIALAVIVIVSLTTIMLLKKRAKNKNRRR